MVLCPQCNSELPDGARICACCGKTFLTAGARGTAAAMRRATAALKAQQEGETEGSDEGSEAIDWKAVGGFCALLVFFVAVGYFATRAPADAVENRNPFLDADGRGRPQTEARKPPEPRDLALGPTKLVRQGERVAVRGQFQNNSRYLLRKAVLEVDFHLKSGRIVGPYSGAVLKVEPGEAVEFAIPAQLDLNAKELRALSWKTSIHQITWGPDFGGR